MTRANDKICAWDNVTYQDLDKYISSKEETVPSTVENDVYWQHERSIMCTDRYESGGQIANKVGFVAYRHTAICDPAILFLEY